MASFKSCIFIVALLMLIATVVNSRIIALEVFELGDNNSTSTNSTLPKNNTIDSESEGEEEEEFVLKDLLLELLDPNSLLTNDRRKRDTSRDSLLRVVGGQMYRAYQAQQLPSRSENSFVQSVPQTAYGSGYGGQLTTTTVRQRVPSQKQSSSYGLQQTIGQNKPQVPLQPVRSNGGQTGYGQSFSTLQSIKPVRPVLPVRQPQYTPIQTVPVEQIKLVQQTQSQYTPFEIETRTDTGPLDESESEEILSSDIILETRSMMSRRCSSGLAELIMGENTILDAYCRCEDGSYGFTCNENFANSCQDGKQFKRADTRLPRNYFLHCSWGIPYLKVCPLNMTWDDVIVACVRESSEDNSGSY